MTIFEKVEKQVLLDLLLLEIVEDDEAYVRVGRVEIEEEGDMAGESANDWLVTLGLAYLQSVGAPR